MIYVIKTFAFPEQRNTLVLKKQLRNAVKFKKHTWKEGGVIRKICKNLQYQLAVTLSQRKEWQASVIMQIYKV